MSKQAMHGPDFQIGGRRTLLCGGLFLLLLCPASAENADVAKLQALADQGDLSSQTDLGWFLCTGESGVTVNKERGVALIRQAVDKGFVRAEFCLAELYEGGRGLPSDPIQELAWYQKAADAHYPRAEGNVAWIYSYGKLGHPADRPSGRAWYEKASRDGDPFSMVKFASFCLDGFGGPKDRVKAFVWYQRATEAFENNAAAFLASCYDQGGDGIPQDNERAWLWSFIAQFRGISQQILAVENFDRLKRLSAKMDGAQLGAAARKAIDYIDHTGDGQCILDPALDPMQLVFAPTAEHPIEIDANDELVVSVMVNGKGPFRFILDSGASVSIITPNVMQVAGLAPAGVHAAFGKEDKLAPIVVADYAVLGNEVRHAPLLVAPLDDMSRAAGKPIDGMLGGDFLSHFTVKIDYAAKTIGLYDPEKFQPDASFAEMPLVFHGGVLGASATLNVLNHPPITQYFSIDTGDYGAMTFNRAFDREYAFANLVPKAVPWGSATMWGLDETTLGRLQSLSLGAFQVAAPVVECNAEFIPSPSPMGTIGAKIWKRFIVVLDYRDKKLFLQKGPEFDRQEAKVYCGLAVLPDEKAPALLRVFKAFERTPAAIAGFQKDDLITACDGISGTELTLASLRERLYQEGDHTLTVQRGDAVLTLPLKSVPF
jgi:TPR repeat protein